jgi:hypothetical protein
MTDRLSRDDVETFRLREDAARKRNWKRWGPYLGERQWGTVREDYSPDGTSWEYFPHDHARSRAYRWGEDGLLGIVRGHGQLRLRESAPSPRAAGARPCPDRVAAR